MREKSYVLMGEPISRMRPVQKKIWGEQNTIKMAHEVALKKQHAGEDPFTGPISMDITFFMEIPVSWSDQRRCSYENKEHTGRPSITNLLRFLQDIACDVIYTDDCIVESINIYKRYGLEPRTEFTVKENRAV